MGESKIDRKSLPFIIPTSLVLGVLLGITFVQLFNSTKVTSDSQVASIEDSKYVEEIYKIIQNKYLGEVPDGKELDYAKIKGIVDSLDSKYTSFLTPEEALAYKQSENPNFEGIGISLKFNGENTEIETVLKNYPAETAGLKVGDIILNVDNVDVSSSYPSEVAGKIRGTAGTQVNLEVARILEGKIEFQITREKIDIDNISYKKLENGIYQISIFQFVDETPEALNKSWDRIVNEISANNDATGIILDLRNNPGGYVYSVKYIMEEFFTNTTTLFKEKQKNMAEVVYTDRRTGKFESLPLVIIVNEGSASASEIFTAAVQDHNRGKVVGTKTVGKGVEQEVVEIEDGSMLVIVFQQWLTPNGRNVTEADPITPEFIVDYTEEDYKNLRDPQLDKAVEILR